MDNTVEKALDWIEETFSQKKMPTLYKPYEQDGYTVIFADCFAIVLYQKFMELLIEDDGHWFIAENGFNVSSAWIPEIMKLLLKSQKYLEENGEPYNFANTNNHCGYELK